MFPSLVNYVAFISQLCCPYYSNMLLLLVKYVAPLVKYGAPIALVKYGVPIALVKYVAPISQIYCPVSQILTVSVTQHYTHPSGQC